MGGDDRRELADLAGAQDRVGERQVVEVARGDRIRLTRRIQVEPAHGGRHRAVEQARVEVRQAVIAGERLGDRALARRGGPVDGDDHALSQRTGADRRASVSRNWG
jgi:hypothetical protein